MDIKKILEEIVDGLSQGMPVSQILIKCQILASAAGNEGFSHLIEEEQKGYYLGMTAKRFREMKTCIKVYMYSGYSRNREIMEIPADVYPMCRDDNERHMFDTFIYWKTDLPLCQMEEDCNHCKDGVLIYPMSTTFLCVLTTLFSKSKRLESAEYHIPVGTVKGVIEMFKTCLLDFCLKLINGIDWSVDITEEQNKEKFNAFFEEMLTALDFKV